jgi:hypothetical protein
LGIKIPASQKGASVSFWLHQNRIMRVVATVQPSLCYGVAGLLAAVLLGVGGYYGVLPLKAQADAVCNQFTTLAKQVSAFEAVLDHVPEWQTEYEALVKEKSHYAADIALLQDTINDLLLMMRRQKISCRGIQPLCSKHQEFHDSHLLMLRAKGPFHQLLELLQELEKPKYPITVRAVRLERAKGKLLTLEAIIHVISVKDE